jgi:hypothetical protein
LCSQAYELRCIITEHAPQQGILKKIERLVAFKENSRTHIKQTTHLSGECTAIEIDRAFVPSASKIVLYSPELVRFPIEMVALGVAAANIRASAVKSKD